MKEEQIHEHSSLKY